MCAVCGKVCIFSTLDSSHRCRFDDRSEIIHPIDQLDHMRRRFLITHVGVDVERDIDLRMAHDILQDLYIHPSVYHIRAERVSEM